jgi:hypothetical protein
MDWSLLDPTAPRKFLRSTLAYKQHWMYYVGIVIDPILRFTWIFYAIFASDTQHSTLLSFFIGLLEIFRRGYWVLFRVENEHCTTVGRFRASRNLPLPFATVDYEPASLEARIGDENAAELAEEAQSAAAAGTSSPATIRTTPSARITPVTTGSQPVDTSPSLRLRRRPEPSPLLRGLTRVGGILHSAHAQDFERRRKPEDEDAGAADMDSSDDEADEAEEVDASSSNSVNGQKKKDKDLLSAS